MDATDGSTSHGVLGVVTALNADGTFAATFTAAEGSDGNTIVVTEHCRATVQVLTILLSQYS